MSLTADPVASRATTIETRPLSPALGVEVVDFDVSRPVDDPTIAALRRLVDDHGVLLFRGQALDADTQIAFSQRFGRLQEVAQKQYQMPGKPLIYVIGNVVENGVQVSDPSVGRLWHSDQSFLPHPAIGSLLYGVECPPEGGDTLFANMYRAYETLPADVRDRIEHLRAVHSFAEYYEELRHRDPTQPALTEARRVTYPDVVHPLVRRDPVSGRRSLYINPGYATRIVELPDDEGSDFLDFLVGHARGDDLVYAHAWRAGDLVMWSNLAVNHKGTDFDTTRFIRRMHRTTVAGDAATYLGSLLPQ